MSSIWASLLPVRRRYSTERSSTGKSVVVAPYSGVMFATHARCVAVSVWTPSPVTSTSVPTTPSARSSCATVSARSMPLTPSRSLPVSLSDTTGGTSMEMGWPRAAASASMPPTPQPSTPRPFAVVVWESVPTSVSKHATGSSSAASASVPTTWLKRSMFSWWQMPSPGGTMRTLSKEFAAHLRNAKRSRLRWASLRWFWRAASSVPVTSAMTEWSTTRVHGMRGLTLDGSPPRSTIASRMAAKSTKTGTPVKS